MDSWEIFFSKSSFITPSFPILSSLSNATVKSINCSEIPANSAKPDKIFLLLISKVTGICSSEKDFKYN